MIEDNFFSRKQSKVSAGVVSIKARFRMHGCSRFIDESAIIAVARKDESSGKREAIEFIQHRLIDGERRS